MALFDDPKKARTAFIISVVISSLLILTVAGVLGYICYSAYGDLRGLRAAVQDLQEEAADYEDEIDTLTAEKTTLTDTNKALEVEVNDYKTRMAKIDKYNIFHDYLNDIIIKHNGFSGWTTAEFNTGEAKAEDTGDAALVSAVNNAWYNYNGDPVGRVTTVYTKVIDGIDGQIK